MNEQELRTMVREAIARHTGSARRPEAAQPGAAVGVRSHASHGVFVLPAGGEGGACLIEPAVTCNHCGYCKSYGH